MAIIRSLFWFAVFLVSTFVFTVIFEHGVSNFGANADREFKLWQDTVTKWKVGGDKKAEKSEK
jgi:hypothetical protein